MAVIQYSDGTKVQFDGTPTQADAEQAYQQIKGLGGATPPAQNPAAPTQPQPDNRDFLQKTGDIVNKFFPGAKVGQGIENSVEGIGDALKGDWKGAAENADANGKMAPQIFGDAANAGLTAASFAFGGGESALSRIGTNAAFGAGMGAASSIANGETDPTKIAQQGAFGGATGLASGIAGEAVSKLADTLPKSFVQRFLPKLNDDTTEYALKNMKMGSVSKMIDHSSASIESYNNQIKSILSHPDNAGIKINGEDVVNQVLSDFPRSEYTPDEIFAKMKGQVPAEAATITKLQKGEQLSLEEANTLRQTVDKSTFKPNKIDSPEIRAGKEMAASFGNALRNQVQTLAPETQPVFSNFSKEINLQKSLNQLQLKMNSSMNKPSLYDFLRMGAGGLIGAATGVGGIAGGIGAEVIGKVASSPNVILNSAKVLNKAAPVIKTVADLGEKAGAISGKIPVTGK